MRCILGNKQADVFIDSAVKAVCESYLTDYLMDDKYIKLSEAHNRFHVSIHILYALNAK